MALAPWAPILCTIVCTLTKHRIRTLFVCTTTRKAVGQAAWLPMMWVHQNLRGLTPLSSTDCCCRQPAPHLKVMLGFFFQISVPKNQITRLFTTLLRAYFSLIPYWRYWDMMCSLLPECAQTAPHVSNASSTAPSAYIYTSVVWVPSAEHSEKDDNAVLAGSLEIVSCAHRFCGGPGPVQTSGVTTASRSAPVPCLRPVKPIRSVQVPRMSRGATHPRRCAVRHLRAAHAPPATAHDDLWGRVPGLCHTNCCLVQGA